MPGVLDRFGRATEPGVLFGALARSQEHIDRFLGVLTGAVPMEEFLSPRNLMKIVGVRGMAKMARLRMRAQRRARRPAPIPA